MTQAATEVEREAAIAAIMRERGYGSRTDAEWEYRVEHGEPVGDIRIIDGPETIEDLIDAYGEEGAAAILRHPIERARFGLPPLTETDATPPGSQRSRAPLGRPAPRKGAAASA